MIKKTKSYYERIQGDKDSSEMIKNYEERIGEKNDKYQ